MCECGGALLYSNLSSLLLLLYLSCMQRNESNFSFKITKPGKRIKLIVVPPPPIILWLCIGILHGFGSWFDVTFGGVSSSSGYDPVTLSTSPSNQWVLILFHNCDYPTPGLHSPHTPLHTPHPPTPTPPHTHTHTHTHTHPRQTHWKQDLLVIDCPLEVITGDTIEGRISITRNKIWRRHLKIDVEYKHFSGKAQETSVKS